MKAKGRLDVDALGLNITRYTQSEAYCLCPFHSDHSPSASISLETGMFHCFACGYSTTATYIAHYFGGEVIWTHEPLNPGLLKSQTIDLEWVSHTQLAIDNGYLAGRHVTNSQIRKHGLAQNSSGIIIPLQNHENRLVGVQLRRYSGVPRYLTYGEKPPLWPIQTLSTLGRLETLYIVEGVFGVLRAERAKKKAVALMGAGSIAKAIPWLNNGIRKRFVFDNDDAGYMGMARLLYAVGGEAISTGLEADELNLKQWREINDTFAFTRNPFDLLENMTDPKMAKQSLLRFIAKAKRKR